MRLAALATFALALAVAGCVHLTPAEQQAAAEVRAMVDETARVYAVSRISVLVGDNIEGVGGTYRQGLLTISTPMLRSRHRDSIVAHEVAHYLLGHDRPLAGTLSLDRQREQELRELDANAKAVEILVRVRAMPEEQALSFVYEHLLSFDRVVAAHRTVIPWGHRPPCDEMHDLLARFPVHRGWSDGLPCARAVVHVASPVRRPAAAPAAPDAGASGLLVHSYFSDRPPASDTPVGSDHGGAPPPRALGTFDRGRDGAVTLCLGVPANGHPRRIVSRWYDESGRERRAVTRVVEPPAVAAEPWTWHTHSVPMWELRPYPGRWTVNVWVDDAPAGASSFSLAY